MEYFVFRTMYSAGQAPHFLNHNPALDILPFQLLAPLGSGEGRNVKREKRTAKEAEKKPISNVHGSPERKKKKGHVASLYKFPQHLFMFFYNMEHLVFLKKNETRPVTRHGSRKGGEKCIAALSHGIEAGYIYSRGYRKIISPFVSGCRRSRIGQWN